MRIATSAETHGGLARSGIREQDLYRCTRVLGRSGESDLGHSLERLYTSGFLNRRKLFSARQPAALRWPGLLAVNTANCHHKAVVTSGKHSNDHRSSAGSASCLATSRLASAAILYHQLSLHWPAAMTSTQGDPWAASSSALTGTSRWLR